MSTFLFALLAYGFVLLALALGRLCGRAGLQGTCARDCDACPRTNREPER